ncbi:serine-rich adhesin for platelets-like isoform X2 [Palaemon carinicauda]
MDEMESIARKLSIDPLNGSERNLTETHLSEESYDISYGPNSLSNRSSLSLGDVQMSSKKNSISGSLSGQSDSLQTHEISNVKSLDNQTPDYHTDVNERRKSIALEVLDFISRRVSNAFDASKENPTFVEKDEEDYSLFPQDSTSREETYQPQSGSTSDIDNRRVSRGSISGKGVSNPPRLSISLEETKNSPRKSISHNSDKLDAEDIILYDQRRKSVTMDALNFMVRKFSSEPIPDHQSKKLNNNPEQEDDVHKSALDESSRRNSRSSVQSDHRLSRRSSLSIKDGNGLQRGSVTHESEQRSQRGSISSEYENKTKRNSFFNEANRSQRSSITDNDYSAPDIEPLLLDKGERSPRGSISSGGSHRSPLMSKSIDEYERTFVGSVSSQDAQKSQRNSLYEDEVKSPIRFPEDITPNDTQELKYDSLKDETHGEQRRDSIGRGILGFIARRFSNVSENEPSNSIPSMTVKEHDDSQAYESFHENQRTDISSSQNHRKPSLENQQRDSRFIDEEDDSSLKRSISSRDGPGHQRGSVSFEDNLISRKASTVSSKSSIVHDGQGSQRRSISAEEEKWYYDDLLSLEGQTSRRGSASADHVPQFRRESFSVDVRQMSPRGSVSPDGQRSIAAQDNHRYSRGSISQRESDNVNEISRSRRSSVSVEESYRTRRGSTIEKEQGSQRGSISSEYDERPRRYSISYSDGNASHRGSIIVDDNQRSRENSVAMDDGRSHKGSILDQVSQRSSRGSISLQETQATYQGPGSPRVSISNEESPRSCQVSKSIDEGQRSRSGSVSTQDRQISQMNSFYEEQVKSKDRPPEGALAKDNQDEKYDSLKENTYETERRKSSGLDILGFITRRFSNASENEHRNSIPSITVEEHEDGPAYEPRDESRRPSSSSLESYQRSSIDDHQMSRRDSNFLDEEATSSRKKSILTGDEHRSQRDSISSEDDHISRKSSIVSHKDKRSSKGSIMYDNQGSHRGSISADESKGYFSDSLSIEESQASRRDSATADYGRQSQSGSFSVEAKQISRRGSVSADDGQGSRKGSLSLVDHKSHHRQSLIVEDETYQSISDQDIRRSSTSSNRVSQKSPRGSLSLQRSPRGSISTEDSHSSSQLPESVDERHEPHSTSEEQRRKSIGMDVLGFIARRFSNTSETEVSNPIPSITTEEHRNSQSYESPHESRKSSISSSQNYNRSSIDNQQVSQRDAMFLDEEAVSSRRSSISNRDGHRSHRGSLLAEDNQISRKGSTVSDKDKRSSKGSIMYDGQGSQRGSITADESKGYFNDSLSMEESQTSRRSSTSSNRVSQKSPRGSLSLQDTQSLYQRSPRGSISTGDSHSSSQIPESVDERHEPHSTSEEQRRKSIGMDVLGFIARRFSNASENEVSNPIPSITTEEHRNSQSYESPHESRRSSISSSQNYNRSSIDNQQVSQRDATFLDEEAVSSRRSSISIRDGQRSHRGSLLAEDNQISRKGSTVSDKDKRSSKGSIMYDGQGSQRGSISADESKGYFNNSLSMEESQTSRRSSTSSNRVSQKSPRGSLSLQDTQSLYQRSPRGSISTGDSHSSSQIPESVDERHEPHSTSEEQRRKSIGMDVLGFIARRFSNASENEVSNPIPSITTEEHRNSQSYESPHESRRSSISSSQNYNRSSIDNQQVSQRDAMFLDEEAVSSRRSSISIRDGHRSHRGSLLAEDNQISRKGSTVSDKDKRSSKGSIMYDGQGSQRGSISADESKGYFNDSMSMEESQTSRRSSTSSNRVSQKSPRGSLSLQDTQSLYQRSPRGSISTGDSHSSSQIPESVDERHEPRSTSEEQRRKSIGMDVLGFIARRFSNASENEVSNPIPSITTEEHRNSQSYESPHESRRSSISSSQNYNRSSIDNQQVSQRDATFLDEEAVSSRRSSISIRDGQRSHRGSLLAEDNQISRKGSTVSDKDKRSSKGSIMYDGQGSQRGSISADESKGYFNNSLSMEESQTSRRSSTSSNRVSQKSPRGSLSLQDTQSLYQRSPRGSISTGDSHSSSQIPESVDERHEPHSTSEEQRRKSIGMDVLGFIARRFSNASENEVSNPIPSITTEEHRNSQSYESPHESRKSSISSSQNYNRSSIDNQQVSQRDAMFLDEEAVSSRRSSISIRDGHRSHRGSLLAEDNQISRKGSTVSDKDKRSSKGSIMYDGQGSQRGSISADESKGYFNDSLSMEESQTSRRSSTSSNRVSQKSPRGSLSLQDTQSLYQRSPRGSISTGDSHSSSQIPESVDERHEPHSTSEEQRRKSIGMDVLGFIARRFSNASENEVSNPIPSITTEEHRNSQSYESFHERRESDSDPNDMYEKNINCNIPNETPDVILHHHIQRSFSEETPEITDYGSDSESGSELNFDLALTEIESDIQSTIVENMNQTNKHKLSVHQNDIHFTNMQKDEGVTPDIYEALYGHIITLLTLPELGGTEHELCATFIPDVTLESSINDTEWIEISQKNQNITGSPASSINQMSSLTILDKKGGWTTVDAIQEQKKRKPLDSISTVTFCGCGFLGVYLVGAATYLQERAPHVLHGRLAGSSVGSLIATCLACDVPLEYLHKTILATADVAQKYFMGPFNPFFPLEEPLMKNLLKMIPEDGHIKASGRLFLSLTRATTLTNEIVSEYSSRDELVRAILCCCFLPFISGFTVPSFNGRKYIDGGMSNNMPLKGPNTLTINAFSGEFDICPEDPDGPVRPLATAFNQSIKMTNNNLTRLVHSLLPPSSELLDKHFHQGYSDAKKYFSL